LLDSLLQEINKMLKNVIVKKNVGCFVYINT